MREFTLLGFIAELETVKADIEQLPMAIVMKACAMVAKQAKAQIGKEHEMWPALAPSTVKDRVSKGYAPNAPLLRDGTLRDSIVWTARPTHDGAEGSIGSDLDRALWLEIGTSKIPPRSFLVSSIISMEPHIIKMATRMLASTLEGGGRNSHQLRELLHLARHAWHQIKKDIELLTDDGEGDR